MHFKLIIALVNDDKTEEVIETAKNAGATGSTIINSARGEGSEKSRSFFGLNLESSRDMILFLVEEHLARYVLEMIETVGSFDTESGSGIAFQIDVEDVVGLSKQVEMLTDRVEEEL